jgi:hypothetical protein
MYKREVLGELFNCFELDALREARRQLRIYFLFAYPSSVLYEQLDMIHIYLDEYINEKEDA